MTEGRSKSETSCFKRDTEEKDTSVYFRSKEKKDEMRGKILRRGKREKN